jgi:hypothetical protein
VTAQRAGYLNLPPPQITSDPQVTSFTRPDGSVVGVVELGGGATIHLETAEGARALAAAFTRAAGLIQAAEGGAS